MADILGFERFALAGASGGCPYALACACRLPHRVSAVATLAGLGPTTEKSLRDRMGLVARIGFLLACRAPPLWSIGYGALGYAVARHPQLNFILNRPAPPDRAMLAQPKLRSILMNSVGGVPAGRRRRGPRIRLARKTLGFPTDRTSVPLRIWHGQLDETVPPSMVEFLAGRMPRSQLRMIPDEGHISLPVRHGPEILGSLLRVR